MQTLRLKKTDGNGQEIVVGVQVLRSWQDGSGRQLYLHSNGVYGYKDGSPVQSADEFSIIGSPVQREMAEVWWKAVGKEMSKKFYSEREEEERRALGDFHEVEASANTELDNVLYRRRENKTSGKKADWGQPFAWMECFSRRPDWWGQAEKIVLPDYEYQMVKNVNSGSVSGNVSPDEV